MTKPGIAFYIADNGIATPWTRKWLRQAEANPIYALVGVFTNKGELHGYKNRYRIRVGDDWVLYIIENDELVIVVVKAGHRRDVYE